MRGIGSEGRGSACARAATGQGAGRAQPAGPGLDRRRGGGRAGGPQQVPATVDGAAGRGPDVSASMSAGWTGPQFGPDRVRSRTWAPVRTASRTIRTAAGRGTPAGRAGGCAQEKPSPAGGQAVFPHGRASCIGHTLARAHNARLRERSATWPRGWGCANQAPNPLPTRSEPAPNHLRTQRRTPLQPLRARTWRGCRGVRRKTVRSLHAEHPFPQGGVDCF